MTKRKTNLQKSSNKLTNRLMLSCQSAFNIAMRACISHTKENLKFMIKSNLEDLLHILFYSSMLVQVDDFKLESMTNVMISALQY